MDAAIDRDLEHLRALFLRVAMEEKRNLRVTPVARKATPVLARRHLGPEFNPKTIIAYLRDVAEQYRFMSKVLFPLLQGEEAAPRLPPSSSSPPREHITNPVIVAARASTHETLSEEQHIVLQLALAGYSMYIGGKAGTGKSVLTREIARRLHHDCGLRVAVTASTGVAASNIGGHTFHSVFRTDRIVSNYSSWQSKAALAYFDVIIIDEVSMFDAAMLTRFDAALRKCRGPSCETLPFGGAQVILTGDFMQLRITEDEVSEMDAAAKMKRDRSLGFRRAWPPARRSAPIVQTEAKADESFAVTAAPTTQFLFDSPAFQQLLPLQLTRVVRQCDDQAFAEALEVLRRGALPALLLTRRVTSGSSAVDSAACTSQTNATARALSQIPVTTANTPSTDGGGDRPTGLDETRPMEPRDPIRPALVIPPDAVHIFPTRKAAHLFNMNRLTAPHDDGGSSSSSAFTISGDTQIRRFDPKYYVVPRGPQWSPPVMVSTRPHLDMRASTKQLATTVRHHLQRRCRAAVAASDIVVAPIVVGGGLIRQRATVFSVEFRLRWDKSHPTAAQGAESAGVHPPALSSVVVGLCNEIEKLPFVDACEPFHGHSAANALVRNVSAYLADHGLPRTVLDRSGAKPFGAAAAASSSLDDDLATLVEPRSLRIGSRVMITRNLTPRIVNGSLGVVIGFGKYDDPNSMSETNVDVAAPESKAVVAHRSTAIPLLRLAGCARADGRCHGGGRGGGHRGSGSW